MNRAELKNILQSHYNRDLWIKTLHFLSGNRNLLTIQLSPTQKEFDTAEANRLIKTFSQIGTLKTSDGVVLPIFEIILEDGIRIEYNRVGVNEFIKKFILKDAIKGALTTFAYDENNDRNEWRFSFISKNSASDFFAEAESIETNPKKYTYIFGTDEEHRTAIERLYNLEQSRFRLEDFFEAFNVEPVSKKFFDEYKNLYKTFSDYISGEDQFKEIFLAEITDINNKSEKDITNEVDKNIRNFVSRLLGRMVFLYFLQKKHWLGASNTEYKDGSNTFLSDLFFNDKESQNDYYEKYLSPIFFNALNTPDRKNEEFKLHNGKTVCIPFLNGGLFEEEQEPKAHRKIQFPTSYFEMLFNFFNGYNFTIYENSPEEHTVAVDPEMLGHIFENLIDYNKDTGTFYTPKEIVQYMTQESLIEYLNTHVNRERKDLENLVKNHYIKPFSNAELEKINQHLEEVKICDPAIGSGAFPMGILQEIFNLKAVINYQLGYEVWSPATVKQNIIQKSIYGVDLDEGAVEIARLRFWLSLVVDEGMPKPLPNLSYKILVGNSLVNKFEGLPVEIDWSLDSTKEGFFAQDIIEEKIKLLNEISIKQKDYFFATGKEKNKLHQQITRLKLEILSKELEVMITTKGTDFKSMTKNSKKQNEIYEQTIKWKDALNKINSLKNQNEITFSHFDWALDFPEILNPNIINEKERGFDIVIGNPPYIEFKKIDALEKIEYTKHFITANRKYDVYGLFIELSFNLLKKNGVHCFINPTTFLMKDFGNPVRKIINDNFEIIEIFDFSDFQIFNTAITYTGIFLFRKNQKKEYHFIYQKLNGKSFIQDKKILFDTKQQSDFKEISEITNDKLNEDSWVFGNSLESKIMEIIEMNPPLNHFTKYTFQGIATGKDEVFLISEDDLESNEIEKNIVFPLLRGRDVNKYKLNWSKTYVIYPYNKETNKVFSEAELINEYPNLHNYLKKNRSLLEGRGYFDNSNKLWFELWNERNLKKFQQKKIVNAEISPENRFQIDDSGFLGNTKIFSTVLIENFEDYYYNFLGILNSKLLNFYHKKIASPKAGGFYDYKTQFIQKYPIKLPLNKKILDFFVKNILFINSINHKIIDIIDNNHIANFFEEVIDAVVFEIYFPEEMQEKNITVIAQIEELLKKHQAENFENLNDEDKRNRIASIYKELSTGIVQEKMADFILKSPDILKPILQS